MERVLLNGTDIRVSRLGMGTTNFGSPLDQDRVNRHIDRFMELGGNLIDTAHVYGDWLEGERHVSEKMIGRYLKDKRRDDFVLCTKGAHFDLKNPEVSRVRPECLREDLSESLDCLNTDYVDVYMLHRDNEAVPVNEIVDCMADFVRDGRVRCVALSNWTARRHAEANAYAERKGLPRMLVNEVMYSMARPVRDKVAGDLVVMDDEMLDFGRREGISFFCYSALAKGYLTKKYLGLNSRYDARFLSPENEALAREMKALPTAADVTRMSLRFFVREDITLIPLVSFSSMEQLEECAAAFDS